MAGDLPRRATRWSAPTGWGKTLAAFLAFSTALAGRPAPRHRLVYVSPLKALANDVERNLRRRSRGPGSPLRVAVRTGDTPPRERERARRRPTS